MTNHQQLVQKAEQNPGLVVADICLYGIRQTGAGWLAATHTGRTFGTGDPIHGQTFTEAVFQAVEAIVTGQSLRRLGLVRIFHPGGEQMTVIDLADVIPTYGQMASVAAPVYMLKSDVALKALAAPAVQARVADLAAERDALAPIDARD